MCVSFTPRLLLCFPPSTETGSFFFFKGPRNDVNLDLVSSVFDTPERDCIIRQSVCVCVCQSTSISILIRRSVVSMLSERCMHGADGRRPAHEPPVLRGHVRHRRREQNRHRPHGSAGEGARLSETRQVHFALL